MRDGINSFNAALINGAKDPIVQKQVNYLIGLLNTQIKILNAAIGSGLSISSSGVLSLGNELQALQALTDTAGLVKKTGDAAYSIDTNTYATENNAIAYAIVLG
jgi:hypothetical protein